MLNFSKQVAIITAMQVTHIISVYMPEKCRTFSHVFHLLRGPFIYHVTSFSYLVDLGLDRTGHMFFLTGQDRTPKFAGQVLPDRTESGLIFLDILLYK